MINQALKMKPQLCFSKEIDSSHALRQFSIKNYNHLSKFKVVREPRGTGPYGLSGQIPEFRKLKQISSSLRSVKHLNLSRFKAQNFAVSQSKLFLKQFYKIQKFSSPWGEKTNDGLLSSLFFIQKGKYLKDLSIQASFSDLTKGFLSYVSLCKIRTLEFTQIYSIKDKLKMLRALFDSCPPILKNLSIFGLWNDSIEEELEKKVGKFQFPSSVKNLQKLELRLRLIKDDVEDIFRSISDASKLKCLRFNIMRGTTEARAPDEIETFLQKCINLEVLEMRTGSFTKTGFYPAAANLKLKKLMVEQYNSKDEDLRELENLLERQRDSLESLSLRFREIWSKPSSFGSLFGKIRLLKNLRKLELRLISFSKQPLPFPTCEPLTEIVGVLGYLEEIDLEEVEVDFKKEKRENFEKFCKALCCCKALKSLKLSLTGCPYPEILIQQTLERLPKLEDFKLRKIMIKKEGLNFYDRLRDLVCLKNPSLNSLVITEERQGEREDWNEVFIEMLQEIIRKPSMKNLCYSSSSSTQHEYFPKKLELSEILKQVHHFESIYFASDLSQPRFDSLNLGEYKWGSE